MVYSGLVLAEGEPYTFPEGGDPSASSGGRSRWEPPGRGEPSTPSKGEVNGNRGVGGGSG
jgi:hypothetical protein